MAERRQNSSGWYHGSDLKEEKWYDKVLMFVLAFIVGAGITWGVVLYAFTRGYGTTYNERRELMTRPVSREEARQKMLGITVLGGITGVVALGFWMASDAQKKKRESKQR